MNISILARPVAALYPLCLLLASAPLLASNESPGDRYQTECTRVQKLVQPETRPRSKDPKQRPPYCDSHQTYYHLKGNPAATPEQWNAVRACAASMHDDDVLMMMYYNGYGVKRNRDRALYYGCDLYGDDGTDDPAHADIIERLLSDGKQGELDICDYAGVQLFVNMCASWREEGMERVHDNKVKAIRRRMTPKQQSALDKLAAAADHYADASGAEEEEISRGGSGNIAFTIGTRQSVRQQFLDDLEKSERGEFPDYDGAAFKELDRQLNEAYRDMMRDAPQDLDWENLDGQESKGTLRDAERAWLHYRDAWVAFARLRYPKVPAHVWKAQLTRQRLDWLTNPQ